MPEWVGGIEMIDALAVHPGAAGDAGNDFSVGQFLDSALEDGIEDTGLMPDYARLDFSIGVQAGEFGAGAGAAG